MSVSTQNLAAGPASTASAPATGLDGAATALGAVPTDVAGLSFVQHLAQALPAADIAFGGAMLVAIILIHSAGVRVVTDIVSRRMRAITARPRVWHADVVMALSVLLLLVLHLAETMAWASSLVYGGLVTDWRTAGFFAGNTYTTVGYGAFVLPQGWEMLAPIIAMSGLFTFGWSGSVLVTIVARCQRVKDLALGHDTATPQVADCGEVE